MTSATGPEVTWFAPHDAGEVAGILAAPSGVSRLVATGSPEPPPASPVVRRVLEERRLGILSTAALAGVVSFRPRDLVVTVRAGLPVARLREVLAAEDQWLPTASGARGSVGGLVAAAPVSAFDHAYGPLRRQLLACVVATHDGRLLRWGRPVVKNVAGYDIQKLLCGSHGRLGILTEASFRTWPRPAARRESLLATDGDPCGVLEEVARVPPAEWWAPDAAVWRWSEAGAGSAAAASGAGRDATADPGARSEADFAAGRGGAGTLRVTLAGSRESVAARSRKLGRWAARRGIGLESWDGEEDGSNDTGEGMAGGERPLERAAGGVRGLEEVAVRVTVPPPDLPGFLRRIRAAVRARDLHLEAYPLQGVLRCEYHRERGSTAELAALLDAVADTRLRVERGGEAEHAAAEDRRPARVRSLEERVVEALGGLPREWVGDYV